MRKVLQAMITLRAVDKVTKVVNDMSDNANKRFAGIRRRNMEMSQSAASFARGTGAAALSMGAMLAVPVRQAANFEQSIANVGAVSRATNAEMKAMGEVARREGRRTVFTASQSADAMQFLAKAGLDASQTMTALPGTLNLAAAGNVDLARSADIATNIMSGFNQPVSELGNIGDTLVRTFTSSNSTLESLAATMKYAAPVANALGGDIQQVAGMAGKLAQNGIDGQMAGTALRGVFLRLAGPTRTAAKALDFMNVNTVDAAGNMRPVPTILADIGRALEKLPTGQRSSLLKDIFETEGTSAATVLTRLAASGELGRYTQSLTSGPGAADIASRRLDTTAGAYKVMQSALEDLSISVGNVLLPALKSLALEAAAVARKMSDWAQANPGLTTKIVKTVAAVTALLGTMAAVGAVISGVTAAIGALSSVFAVLGPIVAGAGALLAGISAPIWAVGAAIAGAIFLTVKYWDKIKGWLGGASKWLFQAGKDMMQALGHGLIMATGGPLSPLVVIPKMLQKIRDMLPSSPAKIGPLSDIHKLKFTETIADSINPKPLIGAARSALDASFNVQSTPRLAPAASGGSSITYSPTINITGGGDKQAIEGLLQGHFDQIQSMIDAAARNKSRLRY